MNNIKRITNTFKKYHFLIWGVPSVIILVPCIVNIGVTLWGNYLKLGVGASETWIGFWGSFLGGIVSGAFTLIGVIYAFKLEKRRDTVLMIMSDYDCFYKTYDWLNSLKSQMDKNTKISEINFYKGEEIELQYPLLVPNWKLRFRKIIAKGINLMSDDDVASPKYKKEYKEMKKDISNLIKEMEKHLK